MGIYFKHYNFTESEKNSLFEFVKRNKDIDAWTIDWPWVSALVKEESNLYVAFENEQAMGLCLVGEDPDDENAEIMSDVFIGPEFRRKGIGSYLVKMTILSKPLLYKTIKLSVLDDKLVSFYKKLGFELIKGSDYEMERPAIHADSMDFSILSSLEGVFSDPDFEVDYSYYPEFEYDDSCDDMFLTGAKELLELNVCHKGSEILKCYVEPGNWSYISFANFERFSGRKFGTKVVGTLLNSQDSPFELRISDRSDGEWTSILNKYPDSKYRYLEL